MRTHSLFIRVSVRAFVVCAALLLFVNTVAAALDFNDVVNLRQNNVPDTVIINMVRQQGGMALTPEQQASLRAGGASEALLAAFAPAPSAAVPLQSAARVAGDGEPITPLRVTEMEQMPAVYANEGWLSISNTDCEPYYLSYDTKSRRMLLSDYPNGGVEIRAGANRALNLRKGTYKLYGESGRDLTVHVREHEVTHLSLVPFGVVGNSGLTGVARDRERTRTEMLVANWTPPVVVQPAPVIVVPAQPPPVYYYDYRYGRSPWGRGYSYGFGW
jgi:hypothetical protein